MRVASFVLGALFSVFGTANAQSVAIPKTGQSLCYDGSGIQISCANTGQDGEIQAGKPWPNSRFRNNGDGTISDKLTGLMWFQDANCPVTLGYSPPTWDEALSFARGVSEGSVDVSACGISATYPGWHLPNVKELESLLNYGAANNGKWLSKNGFKNLPNEFEYYWTSTTALSNDFPFSAMAMDVVNGFIGPLTKYIANDKRIWLVRRDTTITPVSPIIATGQILCYDRFNGEIPCTNTGQDGETQQGVAWGSRFVVDKNGVTTGIDKLTSLMWTKVPVQVDNGQMALAYVQGMNAGTKENFGYTDWRVPSAKEVFSLMSWSNQLAGQLALPSDQPFGFLIEELSSTSALDNKSNAVWSGFYPAGFQVSSSKSSPTSFLAVRTMTFRNAVGNFYQDSGKYGSGECVPYVRYETGLPWAACNTQAGLCLEQAKSQGYYTSDVPKVGAVVVFGITEDFPDGHVGIVTEVTANKITIHDQNWVKHTITTHTENRSNPNIIGYIYSSPY